jgi:hypothetical protein
MANTALPRLEPMKWPECLPWLTNFAHVDLENLVSGRPGDLPNLLFEIRRYLDVEPGGRLDRDLKNVGKNPAALRPALEVARTLVDAVADRKQVDLPFETGRVRLDATRSREDRPISYYGQSLRDAMLMTALDDLTEDEATRIARCEELACHKTFFAGRLGQRYCSHACANATAARKYRETHKIQRAERERKRYDRRRLAGA